MATRRVTRKQALSNHSTKRAPTYHDDVEGAVLGERPRASGDICGLVGTLQCLVERVAGIAPENVTREDCL